jgi:hypothetical protein
MPCPERNTENPTRMPEGFKTDTDEKGTWH